MLAVVLEWLFPVRCVGCARRAPVGVCGACLAAAPAAPVTAPPAALDAWYAVFAYDGVIREAVARLKYRNARAPLPWLAGCLDAVIPSRLQVDAVTWVPTTAVRRGARGFDHAELLARALARRRRIPAVRLLRRMAGGPQTGLGAAERARGPVFSATRHVPGAVLMIDDVTTTGATLRKAAEALRAQGCERVIGATVARTLLKGPAGHSEKPNGSGVATHRSHDVGSNEDGPQDRRRFSPHRHHDQHHRRPP